MNNANSLTHERVHEIVHLNEPLDGAMSAALTRGQLPRRQRHHHHHHHRHHQHRHQHRRSHQHHLRKNNNNNHLHHHHHHHHHHPSSHHGHNCHEQYQYTSQQQTGQEHHHDELECDDERTHEMDENAEPAEKRPKVNPIFLWALQREQRIVEVRCEDYDKRNRIKLTKTPHGWRSIPRTSSNVYSTCCCAGSNYISVAKDKPASSSPSVSSTCVPRSISSKSASSSPSSSSESTSFSSKSEPCNVKTRKNSVNRIQKMQCKTENMVRTRRQTRNLRYHMSDDDESDATRSTCRNSQQSYDLSYIDDQDEDPHEVDYEVDDVYDECEFNDDEDGVEGDKEEIDEANEMAETSRFFNCEKETFRFIDLEKAQKNQLLQPRVVLEPLNTFMIQSNSLRERARLDDEIEMIVEGKNEEVEQLEEEEEEEEEDEEEEDAAEDEGDHDDERIGEINNIDVRTNNLNERKESLQYHCTKTEDSDDEIEEIEDKDDVEELDEENATVFEYEDRDSADMMDDDELEDHDKLLLKPTESFPPIVGNSNNIIEAHATSLQNDIIEEEEIKEARDIVCIPTQLSANNILQVPDLKPINNDPLEKTTNKLTVKNAQVYGMCMDERLLPSPPCSVTCSDDASRLYNSQNSTITTNRRRREAPDLIEVKPTEWRRRGELLRPAQQFRELIEKSGHLIPNPLLVPRDRLPALAASPGIEIPRLLVARPELRLPEALMRPELLADPDILVISLLHLQQVLDAMPEPLKYRAEERTDGYELPNGTLISPNVNSERRKLSVKPIGSLMPAPMDLSRHSNAVPAMEDSIYRMRNKFSKQESEVTSTARLPGDDSRVWHPLFGCRQKTTRQDDVPRPKLISHQTQDRIHNQRPPNYQPQSHQDTDHQHRTSWHRTTLAS